MERSSRRQANSDENRNNRNNGLNAFWSRNARITSGLHRQQEIFERMTSPESRPSRWQERSRSSDATTSQSTHELPPYTTIIAEVAKNVGIAVPNKDTQKWKDFCSEYSVHDPKDKDSLTGRQAMVLADMMLDGKDKYITDEQRTNDEYKEAIKQILEKFEAYGKDN